MDRNKERQRAREALAGTYFFEERAGRVLVYDDALIEAYTRLAAGRGGRTPVPGLPAKTLR